MSRQPARPGGSPPPVDAGFGGGRVALVPLAEETARRHLVRHPEDVDRYGELALEWAVHDMRHVLAWAFGEAAGFVDLAQQVGWLARVLAARDYPLVNLADCLDDAAGVVAERVDGAEGVAARLHEAAASVRPRG
jgi:hypothetical protein